MLIAKEGQLGDKGLLSREESLLRSFEQTDGRLDQYRLDDQDDFKNAAARLGRQMSHQDFVRYVTKLNPGIWAEDSNYDSKVIGFYRLVRGEKKYLVAFEKGYLPEFSIVSTDSADLPVKERRGWRTVLYRLLAQKALTWKQVMEIFGDAHGISGKYWRMLTQHQRQ